MEFKNDSWQSSSDFIRPGENNVEFNELLVSQLEDSSISEKA